MEITAKDVIEIADEYLAFILEESKENANIPAELLQFAINEKLEEAMPQILGMVQSTEETLKAGKVLNARDILLSYVIGYVTAWTEAMFQVPPTNN